MDDTKLENKENLENDEVKTEKAENTEKIESTENKSNNVEIEEKLTSTEQESVQISNDVVAVIAGVAVSEVSGVASMAGGFAGGISEVLSGKKNMAKGIKVDRTDNKLKIDVNIIVEYGTRIPDIAFEIQNRVKKAVESMTGMSIEEVNVHVQGVDTNVKKAVTPALEEAKKEEDKTE